MKIKKSIIKRAAALILLTVLLISLVPFAALRVAGAYSLTENQKNIVARADYMYNATWVCQKTMTGWKGQSTFYKGSTYRIPYAWPVTAGKWVGDSPYGITVDEFLKAAADENSDLYTKQSYYTGNTGSYAPYYGSDCSTFVTYCWGLTSRRTTSTLPNASTLIGNVTAANVGSLLKVGDALNYAGSHVVLVTDMTYNPDGTVASVEITEQTPPQLKRTNHTVASLVSVYGKSYKIYRYGGTVTPPPEGYSPVGNDPDSYTVPTAALSRGAAGAEVSWLQAVLYQLGYGIKVDGIFGSATEEAVSAFRKDYGLGDGVVADSAVIEKLKTLWADKRGYYITTASSLNMRKGDGTGYDVITTIPQGSEVAVIGFNSSATWANIIYNGSEGWVSRSYLSFDRRFVYALAYNTNTEEALPSITFGADRVITVSDPPAHPNGLSLKGWQLLRASDLKWYDKNGWAADQKSSHLFSPGETVTFSDPMLNGSAGDDVFYLCAVWADSAVTPVTPTEIAPDGYGWSWDEKEAYGYLAGYGTSSSDIELCIDLALLPSSEMPKAVFYTDGTAGQMTVSPTEVTVGDRAVAYDWGEVSINNWHDVKFKVENGIGYVFIDGALILSDSGYTANTEYQLLFSFTGQMAIDNAILASSEGEQYFNCSFEDSAESERLMGGGLGKRTYLFPERLPLDLTLSSSSLSITDTSRAVIRASASGDGLSYSWTVSDAALLPYISGSDTDTLTLDIPERLDRELTATLTCTVTNAYGKSESANVTVEYLLTEEVLKGDVNGDGKFSGLDSNLLKRIISGSVTPDDRQFAAADLDGDGSVNSRDSFTLLMLILSA